MGITHEELLRRADAEVQDAQEPPVRVAGHLAAADTAFVDEAPADVLRGQYALTFADERQDAPAVERALKLDDQGERMTALFYGTGLVLTPGLRVAARRTLSGFVLLSADQRAHRAMDPDALRAWFVGSALGAQAPLAIRRQENTVTASREGFAVQLDLAAEGPVRSLSCMFFVGLLLGGDAGALRAGCEGARAPLRVTLRARGLATLRFVRGVSEMVQLPRAAMAVPPAGAIEQVFELPARAESGMFLGPSELGRLVPRQNDPTGRGVARDLVGDRLVVSNRAASSLLLFVDDAAVGWLGPGQRAELGGLTLRRHQVRARTLDGQMRTENAWVAVPGEWEIPALR